MTPLLLFPFDHRGSLGKDILTLPYPPHTSQDHAVYLATKELLFEAFLLVWRARPTGLGILVDAEFGSALHQQAAQLGIPHFLTLERSGSPLRLEAADTLHTALTTLQPTGGKVLVRYRLGDERNNVSARATLQRAEQLCRTAGIPFIVEVLADGPYATHDENVIAVVEELRHVVQPAYWKLEGLMNADSWKTLARGRGDFLVLGRGEDRATVLHWLEIAKGSGVVAGFAIGRTLWADPVRAWRRGTITREQAVTEVAHTFTQFVALWMS